MGLDIPASHSASLAIHETITTNEVACQESSFCDEF